MKEFQKRTRNYLKGFTLIELLVVIGIIAVLAAIVLIAINPARQFAQARNATRTSNIRAILDAVGQRSADNRGVFETGCAAGAVSTTLVKIASTTYNIGPCVVPTYVPALPIDPGPTSTCTAVYRSATDYDTCYYIQRDATTNRITVSAPSAELGETISNTR